MTNQTETEKADVLDWLQEIIDDPENWYQWYSDSEVVWLAKQAMKQLNRKETPKMDN